MEESVASSAAPAAVRLALQRLAASAPEVPERLATDADLRAAVVAVCAASRSLTTQLVADPTALDVLADLDVRPPVDAADELALARWKALEYLRIAARDLVGRDDLAATGAALAALADDVLAAALVLAAAPALVVVGMGKLGGRELNYASDIDVLFVTGDVELPVAERQAREVMRIARRCFRVDANLRPEGRDGPLTRTLASYASWWVRWAQPWEFQALLKARPVAGPAALVAAFSAAADGALWSRPFSSDDLRSLRAMKTRAESEVAKRGLAGRELKRGAGGIRDVEFSVQLLQLVHGRHDPALRSPTTVDALAELAAAGYVDEADATTLTDSYRFLRVVEHRLQLVDEAQVHTVPAGDDERERLARVLGHRPAADRSALAAFDVELARHLAEVRAVHQRLYFRPLLEAFSGAADGLGADAVEARLAAFGFADAERTRQAVAELTRGLTRSSRLMAQLLPLLLGWLSDTPDPDAGLLGLRTLAAGATRSAELARAFRESPEAARRLCSVLGTSRLLAVLLERNPDLVPALGDDATLAARSADELAAGSAEAVHWRAVDERHAGLKRWRDRELLRVGAADVLVDRGVGETAAALTALAEATLRTALDALEPTLPMAVIALGRFGGAELSYASDLDVVVVYDGTTTADFAEAERLATALLRFVGGATPAGRIYPLDLDLRPEGRQGPLARSLEGFAVYAERWLQVWERQAYTRARPVAGDAELGRRLLGILRPAVWERPLPEADVREIRRIKARVERERMPAGEDPQFHLKLGRGSLSDVEWTVQLLQLCHGVEEPGTMVGLERLEAAGALDPADADVLAASYRTCERMRDRLFLVQGGPGDSLPSSSEGLTRLARSLDTTPVALRDTYRRVTRRARAVVDRLFYGIVP